jgi:hypothetical protein
MSDELEKLRRECAWTQTVATEAFRLLTEDQWMELRRILAGKASGAELTRVNPAVTLVA